LYARFKSVIRHPVELEQLLPVDTGKLAVSKASPTAFTNLNRE